jgi:protein TonB
MFEQATLTDGPAGARAWTTFLGLASQVALVSFAVLVPMVWPQVLPTARFLESVAPPLPPAPQHLREVKKEPAAAPALKPMPWSPNRYQPVIIPTRVYTIIDEPAGPAVVGGAMGPNAEYVGVVSGILNDLNQSVRVPPPHIPEAVVKPAATAAPPAILRYTVGGDVHLGAVLHKAEPPYPALAKAARVAGDVELECVVGVDGHIQEVKVKSGIPLLARAAVEAAWQWVYGPSRLNGVPIEIVTILKFSFKLN